MAPDGRRGSSNRGRGRPRGSGRGVTNTRRSTRSATTNPGITKKKSAMEQQLELLKKQIADLSASVATVVPASDNSVRSFSPLSSRVRIENSGKSGKSASLQHRLRDLSPVSDPDKSISHVSAKCRFEPHASAGKYLARALRLSPDVSLNSLDSTINKLRSNHIATSSRKTYQSALNRFIEFCRKFRLSSAHITKSTVLRYVAFLFESGLSYSSAKVYLSALFNAFRECGLSFEFNAPNISQCLIGYKRLRGTVSDRRLPITIDHMRIMKLNIDCSSLLSPFEKHLYWRERPAGMLPHTRYTGIRDCHAERYSALDVPATARSQTTDILQTPNFNTVPPFESECKLNCDRLCAAVSVIGCVR
ncbi:uncharacterized protein LOC129586348 [Paramacrobiotus metropolitanus]|uniref:uncharacterized protein LOC129586348 n=1 Tax=Paramacrobiotus metropolitanus TaxID=2943436 RepID=UPI0024462A0B|nr:uncharacterized protein LOC129586348 [Paramacrobiotus metropolitanus]